MTFRACLAIATALLLTGCNEVRFSAYVEEDVHHAHDDVCGHAWDGSRWIDVGPHVHGPGCGHWWHHGAWHCHPPDHNYDDSLRAHFGIYVEAAHKHSDVCGHCWDGAEWRVEAGHIHGPGCGHHYHSDAWHVHPERHAYAGPGLAHWSEWRKPAVEAASEESRGPLLTRMLPAR